MGLMDSLRGSLSGLLNNAEGAALPGLLSEALGHTIRQFAGLGGSSAKRTARRARPILGRTGFKHAGQCRSDQASARQ